MERMTERQVAEIADMMAQIVSCARSALQRVERIGSPNQMSRDDFLGLAKEVEEVGELVRQLERANRHIVPALFEVPQGNWQGWSGLESYRNQLAHEFRKLSPTDLFDRVTNSLALDEVAQLLDNVESVALTAESFDFGSPDRVAALPSTRERQALQPGSSIILFRFTEAGEALVARSWRDTEDHWRASARWLSTAYEDDEQITFAVCDTEMLLVPTAVTELGSVVHNGDARSEYSLNERPLRSFAWMPRVLGQTDSVLERKQRTS